MEVKTKFKNSLPLLKSALRDRFNSYVYSIIPTIVAQNLEDLFFGDESSLDIATWNIEWFPKNDQVTVNYVTEIIELLDLDILAIQELDDTTMFDQMLENLP